MGCGSVRAVECDNRFAASLAVRSVTWHLGSSRMGRCFGVAQAAWEAMDPSMRSRKALLANPSAKGVSFPAKD